MKQEQLDTEALWLQYKKSNDPCLKEFLAEHYAFLVKYAAGRLSMTLPDSVEYQDLVSYGCFGLLDAVDKFEPERGIKFETYASARIRGAILDGLRSVDWIPRSVRAKARRFEMALRALESTLGRSASDSELAEALGLPLDQYYAMLDEVRTTSVLSLDEVINPDSSDDPLKMLDTIEDKEEHIEERLLHSELLQDLAGAIDRLPERERTVVALYYHESLTLKEIGHVLDVSESRVSQIHTKAIASLRSILTRS